MGANQSKLKLEASGRTLIGQLDYYFVVPVVRGDGR
jgi:hypothetical protein